MSSVAFNASVPPSQPLDFGLRGRQAEDRSEASPFARLLEENDPPPAPASEPARSQPARNDIQPDRPDSTECAGETSEAPNADDQAEAPAAASEAPAAASEAASALPEPLIVTDTAATDATLAAFNAARPDIAPEQPDSSTGANDTSEAPEAGGHFEVPAVASEATSALPEALIVADTAATDATLAAVIGAFAAVTIPSEQQPVTPAAPSLTVDPALAQTENPAAAIAAVPVEATVEPAAASLPNAPAAVAPPVGVGEPQTTQGAIASTPVTPQGKPVAAATGAAEPRAEVVADAATEPTAAADAVYENGPSPTRVHAPESRDRVQTITPAAEFVQAAVRPGGEPPPVTGLPGHRELPPIAPAAAPASAAGGDPDALAARVPLETLAVEIVARAQSGRNRFEIRLDPPELGRIDVRLDIDRTGQVTSRLVVERAETLDVLRRDAHQLERALQDAGLKTADNSLQFSLRDHAFADRNQADTRRTPFADPDRPPAADGTTAVYGVTLRSNGGVDIRV